jgi:uncharacterized membrane protein YdjX (TVP38/TMEM64 family)
MNWGAITLPILGIAAVVYLAMLYWNEVTAEREAAPQDNDVFAKVALRAARHSIRLALEFLLACPPLALILLVIAYAWWEANKSIVSPVVGAIGGSLAVWQIVRWCNRSRTNRQATTPDPDSPPESD